MGPCLCTALPIPPNPHDIACKMGIWKSPWNYCKSSNLACKKGVNFVTYNRPFAAYFVWTRSHLFPFLGCKSEIAYFRYEDPQLIFQYADPQIILPYAAGPQIMSTFNFEFWKLFKVWQLPCQYMCDRLHWRY